MPNAFGLSGYSHGHLPRISCYGSTREFFKNEDAETKAIVERVYREEVKGKKGMSAGVLDFDEPQTPEQFQEALSSLALFAQPFVDATAHKTGGVVALLVCAPMPDDGGELGVLSVHAGRTRGLLRQKWPHAFPVNWRTVQKNMIEFARDVFAPEECLRRILSPGDGPKLKDQQPDEDDDEEEEEDDHDEDLERRVQEELEEEDEASESRPRMTKKDSQPRTSNPNSNEHHEREPDRREHDHHDRGNEQEDEHEHEQDDGHEHEQDDGHEQEQEHYEHEDDEHHHHETEHHLECDDRETEHARESGLGEQGVASGDYGFDFDQAGRSEPELGAAEQQEQMFDEVEVDEHESTHGRHKITPTREEDEQDDGHRDTFGEDAEMEDHPSYGRRPPSPLDLGSKSFTPAPARTHVSHHPTRSNSDKDPLFLTVSSPICSPQRPSMQSPREPSSSLPLRSPAAPVQTGAGARSATLPAPSQQCRPKRDHRAHTDRRRARATVDSTFPATNAAAHPPNPPNASPTTVGPPPAPRARPQNAKRSVSAPNPADKTLALTQNTPGRRTTSLQAGVGAGSSKAPPAPRASHVVRENPFDEEETHEVWLLQPTSAWSDHVRKAVDACRRRGQAWGRSFGDAVLAYVTFEQGHGFAVDGAPARKMNPNMTRPDVYPAWTKVGRPYDRVMDLGMPAGPFHEVWWAWWTALMPSARRLNGGKLLNHQQLLHKITKAEDWEGFDDFCGKDGLLQVLLTLLWWGDVVHRGGSTSKDRADWDAACADFAGMLETVAITLGYKSVIGKRRSMVERPEPSKKPRQSSADARATSTTAAKRPRKANTSEAGLAASQGKSSRRRR